MGNTRPAGFIPENVARIHEVVFYSLTASIWDDFSAVDTSFDSPESNYTTSPSGPQAFEHPCLPLTKILSSGSFYYAHESTWDISSRLSVRLTREPNSTRDIGTFDERFVWNEYIVQSLLDFRERLDSHERDELDQCRFIVSFL